MPIRWVAFDAVGTLMRPHPPVARVYWEAGRRNGSRLPEEEVGRRFHEAFAAIEWADLAGADPADPAALRTSEARESERWRTIVRTVLDDVADGNACFAELYEHFAQPSAWRLFPDVEPAVRALHERGISIAVASNYDERLVRVLRGLPVQPFVRFVVPSSTLGYRKPSRYFFAGVRDRAGCAADELLYVGDDWNQDVLAARNAGLSALHVDRDAVESPADRVTDLRKLVDRL